MLNVFFDSGDIILLPYIKSMDISDRGTLISEHFVLVLAVMDDKIYFLPTSTTFKKEDGTFYTYKRHQKNSSLERYINLNYVSDKEVDNYQPWFNIGNSEYIEVIEKLDQCQASKEHMDPTYSRIRQRLMYIRDAKEEELKVRAQERKRLLKLT